MFKVTELDSEGEIPADFVFEKHKDKLLDMQRPVDLEFQVANLESSPDKIGASPAKETDEDEDELIEQELQ